MWGLAWNPDPDLYSYVALAMSFLSHIISIYLCIHFCVMWRMEPEATPTLYPELKPSYPIVEQL